MLNYRNSSSYGAGILVPVFTFFLFSYVDNKLDQFSYLSIIILFITLLTSTNFIIQINEPRLVKESKEVYDREGFMINHEEVDSDGILFDTDL